MGRTDMINVLIGVGITISLIVVVLEIFIRRQAKKGVLPTDYEMANCFGGEAEEYAQIRREMACKFALGPEEDRKQFRDIVGKWEDS